MPSLPISLNTAFIFDKSEHYYAIGNTPPCQLIPPNISQPKILCLAAGDLRSCFFSISRSDMNAYENVSFVVNDKNAAILARNILLLALSICPKEFGCSRLDLWAVWYSLFINRTQWECVCKALRTLLNENERILRDLKTYIPPVTLNKCFKVWTMWLEMDVTIEKAKAMQHAYMNSYAGNTPIDSSLRMQQHFVREGYLGGGFVIRGNASPLPGLHMYQTELGNLCHSFRTEEVEEETSYVTNNTLFMNTERYNLHYSSTFYESFHLWNFNPHTETLKEYCQSQLAEWVDDLQKCASKVYFEFIQGDCNIECMNSRWQNYFDIIDTSNVSDHIGLAGLLLSCRPLIAPSGIMFTTSMTAHNYSCDSTDYLKKELTVDSKFWAGV